MEMKLEEGIAARIAVPAGSRDVLVFDTTQPGFFLRKFKSGRAMWGVKYSLGDKQRRLHLYDATVKGTLAKARKEAADVRAKARLGTDTVAEKRAALEAGRRSITLGDLAKRYLADRRPAWRPRYYLEVERHLVGTKDEDGEERTAAAWKPLHGLAIDAIRRADIVQVLDDVASTRGRIEGDRAKTALSGLYTWAIDRGYCDATPVLHIKSRAGDIARDRTLTVEELREVLLAATAVGGDYGRIVWLLALTGQRRDEVGSLAWAEVVENDDGTRIELPGERTKNHKPHVVPLSPQALAQFPTRPDRDDPAARSMVFGRRAHTGFSGWSKGKGEIDGEIAAARKKRRLKEPMPAWRLHDLRRTFVTMLGELGIAPPHVIEAIVNHVSGTKAGVAGTYNKASYLEERRKALEALGRYVEELVR